jgi:hypothetical protein
MSADKLEKAVLNSLREDISTTLPSLKLFSLDMGPMYAELFDLLCAWSASRLDEHKPPFADAISCIGAIMSLNMGGNEHAFLGMRNYLERGCPKALYGGDEHQHEVRKCPTVGFQKKNINELNAIFRSKLTIGEKINSLAGILSLFIRVFDTLLADYMPKGMYLHVHIIYSDRHKLVASIFQF